MQYNPYLLAGVLAGNLLRTLAPYLMAGAPKWQWKYITDAFIGFVLAFMGGTLALPAIDPASTPVSAFVLGFFAAISIQTGARQVAKTVARK